MVGKFLVSFWLFFVDAVLDSALHVRPESPSSKDSTEAQVGSPLGEERDERHGKENEADTSFHSCSSSPPSFDDDFDSHPLSSYDIDCWKEYIHRLFQDPVSSIKPPGLTFVVGKERAIEILSQNQKARDLVVERLFQPPTKPVDMKGCHELILALQQERWPSVIMAERRSPYDTIYAVLDELNLLGGGRSVRSRRRMSWFLVKRRGTRR